MRAVRNLYTNSDGSGDRHARPIRWPGGGFTTISTSNFHIAAERHEKSAQADRSRSPAGRQRISADPWLIDLQQVRSGRLR
jgi:hypothetical protein